MNVYVDVIVPVHNAAKTIEETVSSAMTQTIPDYLLESSSDCCFRESLDPHVNDEYKRYSLKNVKLHIAVCCHNDGSTDESLSHLKKMKQLYGNKRQEKNTNVSAQLLISSNEDGSARGAGSARNMAAKLRGMQSPIVEESNEHQYFLCLLDSDDIMHPHRIAHQVSVMLALKTEERHSTLLGSTFRRIPADSTWHYTQWANSLSDERLMLEKFREITILQPTWMMTRARFDLLGGYIETLENTSNKSPTSSAYKLVHPQHDTPSTIRLCEDLRLFHGHLCYPYCYDNKEATNDRNMPGSLKLIRTKEPLMTYRHRLGQSQSSSTSRKLLLHLRVKAFTDTILQRKYTLHPHNTSWMRSDGTPGGGFIIWGAGRDGKDFFKSLSLEVKGYVRCFVDVDEKKIASGYYVAPKEGEKGTDGGSKRRKEYFRVPIVHFSVIARNDEKRKQLIEEWVNRGDEHMIEVGRITKDKPVEMDISQPSEKRSAPLDQTRNKRQKIKSQKRLLHAIPKKDKENTAMIEDGTLTKLPVVVCVAMYRTNNVLENNVENIGRKEGFDLWHFS